MRIFKTKEFNKWAKNQAISDAALIEAIQEMNNGLFEANLGSHIYKKRIALGGKGKSGGARTIIAFQSYRKAFFMYGFAKNERNNISNHEKDALKELAKIYLNFPPTKIEDALFLNELIEVKYEKVYTKNRS